MLDSVQICHLRRSWHVDNLVKDYSSDHIAFLHCSVVLFLCSLHYWTRNRALPPVMSGLCTATPRWYPARGDLGGPFLTKLAACAPCQNLRSIDLQLLACFALHFKLMYGYHDPGVCTFAHCCPLLMMSFPWSSMPTSPWPLLLVKHQ